jgi:DNA-3-methyladenine glycosylase
VRLDLAAPVVETARALLGWRVEHDGCEGVIEETEAYHDSEPACHAHIGLTARTHVLFGAPGTAYVYRSYGIHALLNVVCEPEGTGAAVLIRALRPTRGLERMHERRRVRREHDLCNGPGKLTQALGIDLSHNATRLATTTAPGAGPIALLPPLEAPRAVEVGVRVGITKAADLPWRFCVAGSPWVSRPRPSLTPARRSGPGARRRPPRPAAR